MEERNPHGNQREASELLTINTRALLLLLLPSPGSSLGSSALRRSIRRVRDKDALRLEVGSRGQSCPPGDSTGSVSAASLLSLPCTSLPFLICPALLSAPILTFPDQS